MEVVSPNAVEFVGYPDVETYLALLRQGRCRTTWSKSGRITIALTMIVAIGMLMKNGQPALAAALAVLSVVGLFSLLPTIMRQQIEKDDRRRYTQALGNLKRTGSLTSQGIQFRFPGGRSEMDWSYFDRTAESSNAIGLFKGDELIDAISRSMFASDAAWDSARNTVLEYVKKDPQKTLTASS